MKMILINVIGVLVYMGVGLGFMWLTDRHVRNLQEKVSEIDVRYSKRLLGKWITIRDTKFNRFLADVCAFTFWPLMCVASILKAEWEYDTIVNHSAFERRVR